MRELAKSLVDTRNSNRWKTISGKGNYFEFTNSPYITVVPKEATSCMDSNKTDVIKTDVIIWDKNKFFDGIHAYV